MALGSSGRRIVVEFIGDASSLRNGVREGESALGSFSGKAQAAGRIAGKALAGGLLLAGAAAVKATQAAADDEAAQSQLAQQLKQAAGASDAQIKSTEDWITATGKAKGVADDELRPALARLATATGSVHAAQRLTTLGMSVAAGTGKSLEQVTTALAKAQNGNVGGLGRLGIATKDAAGHTKTLAAITADLADKYRGSAAKAAETTAGKQKILAVQFGELQEQIGTALIPAMTKLANVGLKVVDWISKNTKTAGILVGSLFGLLAVVTLVGAATKVYTAITTVWAAATKIATAAQWLFNAAMDANPIALVVIAIAALAVGLVLAYKKSETFRTIVNAAFHGVAKVVGFVVDFVKDHWRLMISLMLGPFGIAIALISKHWNTIKAGAAAVVGWVQEHWPALKSAIVGPFNAAKSIIGNVWADIKAGSGAVRDKLSSDAGKIKSVVVGAFDAVKSSVQFVIDKVEWLIDKIDDLISKLSHIPHVHVPGLGRTSAGSGGLGGGGLTGAILDGTKGTLVDAMGILDRVADKGKKHLAKLKDQLKDLKDAFKSLRDSVVSAFAGDLFSVTATEAITDSEGNITDAAQSAGQNFISSLQAKKGQLGKLSAAFKTLTGWGWKPQVLASLFQSGNAGLILDLAANKDLATQGLGLLGDVNTASDALGAQVGDSVFGGQIASLTGQINAAGGKGNDRAVTYNVSVSMGLVTDPVAAGREVVKAIRQLERATGRQVLVSGA